MKSSDSPGRTRLPLSLWLIPLCIVTGFAFFFFATPSASAAIFVLPTPTQENLWASVNLPKPTYTPSPLPAPTDTPVPAPVATETPAQLAMEMVNDTASQNITGQEQLAPAGASYGGSKYILVDISEQHMYVYEGDQLVYSFVASTGMKGATRVGTFAVQSKIPNAYGSTWNIWMPSWLGIYWSGGLENGIHALPILPNGATLWAGFLGRPISYGCVVLGSYEAKLLYDWAEIGTPVEIRR
jgi:lipoprotein-anchoring transpeptidase ErfK/SrfK